MSLPSGAAVQSTFGVILGPGYGSQIVGAPPPARLSAPRFGDSLERLREWHTAALVSAD
jgi:hypothetical protein